MLRWEPWAVVALWKGVSRRSGSHGDQSSLSTVELYQLLKYGSCLGLPCQGNGVVRSELVDPVSVDCDSKLEVRPLCHSGSM